MADNFQHFGFIESNKAYTVQTLAAILGWETKEVLNPWFDMGLPFTKIGKTKIVLGSHFIRFVDRHTNGLWDEDEDDDTDLGETDDTNDDEVKDDED